jgi:hypothetical protein
MEQFNQILSQNRAQWRPPQSAGELTSFAPALSGTAALVGGLYIVSPRQELLFVNLPVRQTAVQQPQPARPALVIPGRVTGPVRLIQQVARAWVLTDQELAFLLAYPSRQLAAELLAGQLTFSGNEDRDDRARLMYLIHSTLVDLFVDSYQEGRWIRAPNVLLNNEAPLQVMIKRRIPGMLAVRDVVEHSLAHR